MAKTDAELLEIWRDQIDYRPEVVAWVAAEINRRRLTTSHVLLMTERDQIQREENWYASVGELRSIIAHGIHALVWLVGAIASAWETIHGDRGGEVLTLGLLFGAVFFLYVTWREWKLHEQQRR